MFEKRIIEHIQHVDLLYHEATFMSEAEDKAMETKHSTAKQAATIAQLAKVNKLLLGHFSARYKDLNGLLEEAKSVFMNTELAIEGNEFIIDDKEG